MQGIWERGDCAAKGVGLHYNAVYVGPLNSDLKHINSPVNSDIAVGKQRRTPRELAKH